MIAILSRHCRFLYHSITMKRTLLRPLTTWKLLLLLLLALSCYTVHAWDQQPDGYEVIDGPAPGQSVDEWRRQWMAWRQMELQSVRYDANDVCSVYNLHATQWTQRNFVQAFLMLHDRDIYDRDANEYTVAKYVTAMETRVGKLDSVLLWPAYPNSGIDNRNQWDFLRALPGGLEGLKQLIADFHTLDVRVVLPYNPWDTATRDEDGLEDLVRMYSADILTIQKLLPTLGADGFNGDTMYGVPKSFFNCSAPIVATPEGGVPSAYLSHNPISWGYYYGYSNFPPVARAKFLEPRHMVQVCARWSLDKLAEIQTAFFNGVGYVVWENVWGIWNALMQRESEAAKRAFHVLRKFAAFTPSPLWRPYAFQSDAETKVFASAFPHPTHKEQVVLYTVINAATQRRTLQLPIVAGSSASTWRVYDVYRGHKIGVITGNTFDVPVTLEPRGFGAILVAASALDLSTVVPNLDSYLAERRTMTIVPLEDFPTTQNLLPQTMTQAAATDGSSIESPGSSGTVDNDDMVVVKGESSWWFNVTGVQIEPVAAWTPNAQQFGVGVQFPWEQRPWNNHSVRLTIRDFAIDRHPVTNAQFRDFLTRSKYTPRVVERFLDHWENRYDAETRTWRPLEQWRVPEGLDKSPVVFVAIEDARAYAAFHNKRLVHDWEWQYVASNSHQYDRFPWGDHRLDATQLPEVSRSKNPRLPDAVGSFPGSQATATGVEDLVGLVWQMTDEFCDAHTCGILLRGGSYYRPVASSLADPNWYFPQAYEATQHNRLLTLSKSYDRSAFVGFRCAKTVAAATTAPSM